MPALFAQSGVIRVDTLAELFDVALLLAHQPLPAGPRVAVVGNSTALGVLAADALVGEGMQLAGDPVDTGVTASPAEFAAAVAAALAARRCRRRRRRRWHRSAETCHRRRRRRRRAGGGVRAARRHTR